MPRRKKDITKNCKQSACVCIINTASTLTQCLLYTCLLQCFKSICSFNSFSNPTKEVLLSLYPLYR